MTTPFIAATTADSLSENSSNAVVVEGMRILSCRTIGEIFSPSKTSAHIRTVRWKGVVFEVATCPATSWRAVCTGHRSAHGHPDANTHLH